MLLGGLVGANEPIKSVWRDIDIKGLAVDSRDVREGFLFAALSGSKLDGGRFVADACRRGAAAILTEEGRKLPVWLGVPVIFSPNPRSSLAFVAARFFGKQPDIIAAVTGTNGKTSVSALLHQIWQSAGLHTASLGTVGLTTEGQTIPLRHTMPEPIELHRHLAHLARRNVTHAVLEASSHGLAQHRVDAVRLTAAAFTNITHDHLDYHGSFDAYLAAKLRLFTEVLHETGIAVINADSVYGKIFAEAAEQRGIRVFTVGKLGKTLTLLRNERVGWSHLLDVQDFEGRKHHAILPLAGDFQVSNALVAAGLAIACGLDPGQVFSAFEILEGAPGRLEKFGEELRGASIFIDYAHTPDALRTVLDVLRLYTKRRLIVVFGAGGDRDRGKRPEMGAIASACADIVIVTDDNPRSEDPEAVRAEILSAASDAIEIGDRGTAITAGVEMLRAGDVLLIAGKGHEVGQHVGEEVIPFSDHEAVQAAVRGARSLA